MKPEERETKQRSRLKPEGLEIASYRHYQYSDRFEPICSVAMPGAEFALAVRQVSPSCAFQEYLSDKDRYLAGIVLEFGARRARMLATDKYRLAARWIPITATTGNPPPFSGIVPRDAMREAAAIARADSGAKSAEIALSEDGQVRFRVGGEERIARCILSKYPDLRPALRTEFKREVRVEREALADALVPIADRARRRREPSIELAFLGCAMEVSVEDASLERGEVREKVAAHSESAEELRFSFNPDEIIDGLEAIQAKDVVFSLNDPPQLVAIAPATPDGEEPDFRYLVLPIPDKRT